MDYIYFQAGMVGPGVGGGVEGRGGKLLFFLTITHVRITFFLNGSVRQEGGG